MAATRKGDLGRASREISENQNSTDAELVPSGGLRRDSNELHRRSSDRVVATQLAFAQENIERVGWVERSDTHQLQIPESPWRS
jgi:hypothetical protein